jgi:hypothetical protein
MTVRFSPITDRVRIWAVWLIDPSLGASLAEFVREELPSWVAKTREGHPDVRSGCRDWRVGTAWILVEGNLAYELKSANLLVAT